MTPELSKGTRSPSPSPSPPVLPGVMALVQRLCPSRRQQLLVRQVGARLPRRRREIRADSVGGADKARERDFERRVAVGSSAPRRDALC